jgi:hypothetical protein
MKTVNEATTDRVREAFNNTMEMMKEAGFEISSPVQVVVDPQLPFMGYTTPQGSRFRIVVSGMAVDSGMLEGLLVHEMSHIYRMQTKHPSHDVRLIEGVVNNVGRQALSHDYHQRTIRELVNHIEDLYADDIAIKVIERGGLVSNGQLSRFFQGMVKDEPVASNNTRRDSWFNSSIMVNNARAIGQIRRHRIEDTDDKAMTLSKRFLSRAPAAISKQFEYFKNLFTNLKENISEDDYRRLLTDYLNSFLGTAENN